MAGGNGADLLPPDRSSHFNSQLLNFGSWIARA
jgi:hypothetical protein